MEIESLKTGKLLAYGSHTKYIVEALKGAENMKFSEDGERVLEKGTGCTTPRRGCTGNKKR